MIKVINLILWLFYYNKNDVVKQYSLIWPIVYIAEWKKVVYIVL